MIWGETGRDGGKKRRDAEEEQGRKGSYEAQLICALKDGKGRGAGYSDGRQTSCDDDYSQRNSLSCQSAAGLWRWQISGIWHQGISWHCQQPVCAEPSMIMDFCGAVGRHARAASIRMIVQRILTLY